MIQGSFNVYIAATAALIGGISVGNAIGYNSPTTASVKQDETAKKDIPFTKRVEKAGYVSAVAFGAFFGSFFGGPASQFGRKKAIVAYGIPICTGWFIVSSSHSFLTIILGKVLIGVVIGMVSVTVPTYVVEIAAQHNRGKVGAGFQVFLVGGILITSFAGTLLDWRRLAQLCMLPALLMTITMLGMPETPIWLVSRYGRASVKAEKALFKLRTARSDIQGELDELQELSQNKREEAKLCICPKDLKSADIWKPLLLTFGLVLFQQLCGINAVIAYQEQILMNAGVGNPELMSTLCSFVQFLTTIVCALIIDRVERRKLLLASGIGMTISLAALGIHFAFKKVLGSYTPIVCLFIYLTSYSFGYGPIPWLMIPELTPIHARSPISALSSAANWLLNFLVTFSFVYLTETEDTTLKSTASTAKTDLNFSMLLFIYSGATAVSCIFVIVLLPETKGKSFDEIQQIFSIKHTGAHLTEEDNKVLSLVMKSVKSSKALPTFSSSKSTLVKDNKRASNRSSRKRATNTTKV